MSGVYGVFLALNPWDIGGTDEEARIGKQIVDLAKKYNVEHFVYSSVGGAERNTGIPHFDSKWKIEQHLMKSGLTYSTVRPVFFMENLLESKDKIKSGVLPLAIKPTTKLQMIACDDIGAFSAMFFNKKNEWAGKAIELAGDEMTGEDYAKSLGCKFESVPLEQLPSKEYQLMFKWFIEQGYKADIPQLRKIYPDLLTFPKWANTVGLRKTESSF